MHNSITVITTADPDEALLESFFCRLADEGNRQALNITLVIVDSMAIYQAPPMFLRHSIRRNPSLSTRWLSQKEAIDKSNAMEQALQWVDTAPAIIMDPDMLSNIHDIPRFLEAHIAGAEIVFAWRVKRSGVAWWRRFLTAAFSTFARILLRLPVHDINAPMISLSGNTLNLFSSMRDQLDRRISTRLGACGALGSRVVEVPIITTEIHGRASTYSRLALLMIGISWLKEVALYWRYEKALFSRSSNNDL